MQYRPISVDTFVILGNELHASALWHDITDAAWHWQHGIGQAIHMVVRGGVMTVNTP